MPNKQSEQDMQAEVLLAAQSLISMWPTMLDALDGMIRQTVDHGWPEPMARQIVFAMIARANSPGQ